MTGGGFGGCTVTLLRAEAAASFRDAIARSLRATNSASRRGFIRANPPKARGK